MSRYVAAFMLALAALAGALTIFFMDARTSTLVVFGSIVVWCVAVILVYGLRSRWWKTAAGRSVMGIKTSLALVSGHTWWVFVSLPYMHQSAIVHWIYLLLSLAVLNQLLVILQAQHAARPPLPPVDISPTVRTIHRLRALLTSLEFELRE